MAKFTLPAKISLSNLIQYVKMIKHQLVVVFDGQQNVTQKLKSSCSELALNWDICSYHNLESVFQLLEVDLTNIPESPSLILVDATLPNMAGFDFLYCAKRHPRFKHIPIILLGESDNHNNRSICYHFRGNAYCKMPETASEAQSLALSIDEIWMWTISEGVNKSLQNSG